MARESHCQEWPQGAMEVPQPGAVDLRTARSSLELPGRRDLRTGDRCGWTLGNGKWYLDYQNQGALSWLLQTHWDLHVWPARQDIGHAEAEQTQK